MNHRLSPALLAPICILTWLGGCRQAAAPADETPAPATAQTVLFHESSAERGVAFEHQSGHQGAYWLPEIMGGGAALFDMDQDGDMDLYLVQSGSLSGSAAAANKLFENTGNGQFRDISATSGAADPGYGMGVATGDYNGDGKTDLYLANTGANVLLRNEGGGHFRDVTAESGTGYSGWSSSAAFFDYDRDGDVDLFVSNYLAWSPEKEHECLSPAGSKDYCSPLAYGVPLPDTLYRNNGDGSFSDVSVEMGLNAAFGNGLGTLTADFNDDGWPDIYVANDGLPNQLWMNQTGTRFQDTALLSGTAVDNQGMSKAGMGVATADFDRDGDLDLLVVNKREETDSFYRNEGHFFNDHTGITGVGKATFAFTRFGTAFADFDNDGHLDLFFANGRIMVETDAPASDPYAELNQVLMGSADGRFQEAQPRGATPAPLIATSRAAAFGDIDNDGRIDVVVVNRDGPVHLLHNTAGGKGHWISLDLRNRNGSVALGARLKAVAGSRIILRETTTAYSYQAANDPRIHIGLGSATQLERITIRWPDGQEESLESRTANQHHTITQGGNPHEAP